MNKNVQVDDQTFGDLVLICGDFHIPFRKDKVLDKIMHQFIANKIQHVMCTGNIGCNETYQKFKEISPNFHCVKGQFDDNPDITLANKSITIGQWKFMLLHGHQIIPWGDEEVLTILVKESDSDVIITGNTHQSRISRLDKKHFLNPGSITGAYGPLKQENDPSFIVLEVMGNELGIYSYHLINQEFVIEKTVITK